MKNIFTILLIVCAFIGYGQNDSIWNGIDSHGDSISIGYPIHLQEFHTFKNEKKPYSGIKGTKLNVILLPDSRIKFMDLPISVPVIEINSDTTSINLFGIEVCTIDLLLEYKQECFNDSTIIKVNINPDRNTSNGFGATTCMYYPPKWVDKWTRKTPTFPDFLNWIEKRKNK